MSRCDLQQPLNLKRKANQKNTNTAKKTHRIRQKNYDGKNAHNKRATLNQKNVQTSPHYRHIQTQGVNAEPQKTKKQKATQQMTLSHNKIGNTHAKPTASKKLSVKNKQTNTIPKPKNHHPNAKNDDQQKPIASTSTKEHSQYENYAE